MNVLRIVEGSSPKRAFGPRNLEDRAASDPRAEHHRARGGSESGEPARSRERRSACIDHPNGCESCRWPRQEATPPRPREALPERADSAFADGARPWVSCRHLRASASDPNVFADPSVVAPTPNLSLVPGLARAPPPLATPAVPAVASLDPRMSPHWSNLTLGTAPACDNLRQSFALQGRETGIRDAQSPSDRRDRLQEKPPVISGLSDNPAEGEGFEPSIRLTTDNGFRDRRIRPLCHPSGLDFSLAWPNAPGGVTRRVARGHLLFDRTDDRALAGIVGLSQ